MNTTRNNNTTTTNETTNNTNIYQNHQHRQPVNSTELTQNSDSLNTTLSTLQNVNKPLPCLQRQNSAHFCRTYNLQINHERHTHHGLMDL